MLRCAHTVDKPNNNSAKAGSVSEIVKWESRNGEMIKSEDPEWALKW